MRLGLLAIALTISAVTAFPVRAQLYPAPVPPVMRPAPVAPGGALVAPVVREALPDVSANSGTASIAGGTAPGVTTGWGSGNATAIMMGSPQPRNANADGYCNDEVARTEMRARMREIDDRVALAREMYSPMPNGGFLETSCLGRLLNGGIGVLFSPPNLGNLQDRILQAVCNVATTQYNQARQMMIGQFTNALRQSGAGGLSGGGLPLGNIIPGVNLNSYAGGVNFGSSSQANVDTNVRDIFRAADGGFGVNNYFGRGSYGARPPVYGNSIYYRPY